MNKYAAIIKKTKIYDVVSHYIKLTKKGNNWVGLCNFHTDTNPSLTVSEDKNIFKCFACGVSGNPVKFITQTEHIPFLQALQKACELSGVNSEEYQELVWNDSENQRYFELTAFLTQQYQKCLEDDRHIAVRNYLKITRKLTDEQIQKYQIGYAPIIFGSDLIANFIKTSNQLEETHYDITDAQNLKLTELKIETATWKDFFLNRIIFPIHNEHNQVVGYSGRIWNDHSGPKYLNSAESIIFKKQKILYNFHNLIKLASFDQVYLAEGFMDVIALDKIGIHNTVALMGTSFSNHQIQLLHEYFSGKKSRLVLAFDHDEAGQKFTENTAIKLLTQNFEVAAINFYDLQGNFKDLDEIIQDNNPYNRNLLFQPVNYFAWLYQNLVVNQSVTDYDQARILIDKYLSIFFRFRKKRPTSILVNLSTDYLIEAVNTLFRIFELLNNPQININVASERENLINFIYQNNKYDPKKNFRSKSLLNDNQQTDQSLKPTLEIKDEDTKTFALWKQIVYLNRIHWLEADWWREINPNRKKRLIKNFSFLLRVLFWRSELAHQIPEWLDDHPEIAEIVDYQYDLASESTKFLDQSLQSVINLFRTNLFDHLNLNDDRLMFFSQVSTIFNENLDHEPIQFLLSLFHQYYLDAKFTPTLDIVVTTIIAIKQIINEIAIKDSNEIHLPPLLDLRHKFHQIFRNSKPSQK